MDQRQQLALTFAGGSGQKPSPLNQAKKKKKKRKKKQTSNGEHQTNIATEFCLTFCRTGLCKKGVNCPFSHTPEKVAICKNFLYDKCKAPKCFLSHTLTPDNMPDCNFFLKGLCKNKSCCYRHVKIHADAGICKDFATGFCSKGAQCESLHQFLCKSFSKKGKCQNGKKCTMAHCKARPSAQAVVEINSPQPSDMVAAQLSITTPNCSQKVRRESRNPQTSSGSKGAAASENLAVFLAEAGPPSSHPSLAKKKKKKQQQKKKKQTSNGEHQTNIATEFCLDFCRTGLCKKSNSPCFFSHALEKVAICKKFLYGKCKAPKCFLSHTSTPDNMPDCNFLLKGFCKENCRYRHVKVNADASICKDFVTGFCSKGAQCESLHQFLCESFSKKGKCPKGDECTLALFKVWPTAQAVAKIGVCSNDERLAKLLRRELDLEYDRRVKALAKKYQRGLLFYENERYLKGCGKKGYHEYGEASQYWDFFEKMEKSAPAIGRAGFSVDKKSGRVTTKHDIERARNACKMMEFKSDIRTGDGGGFPMKLNNSVCNALRVHSISMARLHKKKEKSSLQLSEDFYRHRPRRPRRRTTAQVEDGSRLFHSNELYEL